MLFEVLKMKRTLYIFLLIFILSFQNVVIAEQYKSGDIIGHIYSTDIVAYIDNMPIPSYNIGGITVVSENDLKNYGFEVVWKPDARTLVITSSAIPSTKPETSIVKQTPGNIIGDVYYTDIQTWVNSNVIEAYNIGGQTMVSLEALGQDVPNTRQPNHNRGIGFSNYGFQTIWNPDDRTIRAKTIRPGNILETSYGSFKIVDISSAYYVAPWNDDKQAHGSLISPIVNATQSDDYFSVKTVLAGFTVDGESPTRSLFDVFYVPSNLSGGVLTLDAMPELNNMDTFEKGTYMANYANALLPIVELPVKINTSNGVMEGTIKAILKEAEMYIHLRGLSQVIALK